MPIRINSKPKGKSEPDFLCKWNFCDSCIKYRLDHKMKIPKLKSVEGYSCSKLLTKL